MFSRLSRMFGGNEEPPSDPEQQPTEANPVTDEVQNKFADSVEKMQQYYAQLVEEDKKNGTSLAQQKIIELFGNVDNLVPSPGSAVEQTAVTPSEGNVEQTEQTEQTKQTQLPSTNEGEGNNEEENSSTGLGLFGDSSSDATAVTNANAAEGEDMSGQTVDNSGMAAPPDNSGMAAPPDNSGMAAPPDNSGMAAPPDNSGMAAPVVDPNATPVVDPNAAPVVDPNAPPVDPTLAPPNANANQTVETPLGTFDAKTGGKRIKKSRRRRRSYRRRRYSRRRR